MLATQANLQVCFFFSGDAQTYDFSGDDSGSCNASSAISYLMSRVISTITTYFDADDIFLCPGNNDGPYNAIFDSDLETYPQTEAWSDVVVKAGIVNNDLKIQYNYSFDDEKTVTVMNQVGFSSTQVITSKKWIQTTNMISLQQIYL